MLPKKSFQKAGSKLKDENEGLCRIDALYGLSGIVKEIAADVRSVTGWPRAAINKAALSGRHRCAKDIMFIMSS